MERYLQIIEFFANFLDGSRQLKAYRTTLVDVKRGTYTGADAVQLTRFVVQ
jgi:hypothetical protein